MAEAASPGWDLVVELVDDADAAFIAAAREAVPALVAEVRQLRAQLAAAQAVAWEWRTQVSNDNGVPEMAR